MKDSAAVNGLAEMGKSAQVERQLEHRPSESMDQHPMLWPQEFGCGASSLAPDSRRGGTGPSRWLVGHR